MIDKILIFILILMFAVANDKSEKKESPVCGSLNTDHLMHLYSEVLLQDSIEAAIIHIYSEAPDYDYAIEPPFYPFYAVRQWIFLQFYLAGRQHQ